MTYESPEDLWIATEGYGLLNYNKRTNESHYYLIDPSVRFAFNTNIIKSVFYEDGYVWCGTTKGEIYKFNIKTKKFSLYHQYPICLLYTSYFPRLDEWIFPGGTLVHV